MCGIIGYVGRRPCQEILMAGLQRLEYRGYDSAGIALQGSDGEIQTVRAVGDLSRLRNAVAAGARPRNGSAGAIATMAAEPTAGIGHTRWATHGRVTHLNAHPHSDTHGRVHIVLNGIIENHLALREELAALGSRFASETDAEVLAHLLAANYDGDLERAVRVSVDRLHGQFAFVAIGTEQPNLIVGTRREAPLVVGVGSCEHFIASAIPAFLAHTRKVRILREGEIATLQAEDARFCDNTGISVPGDPLSVDWDDDILEKAGFETFMLKEISEQRLAVAQTLAGWLDMSAPIPRIGITDEQLASIGRVRIIACGTSYHAGLAARIALERWAQIPVQVELASEFRYGGPLIEPGTLAIGITQSGETADTLAAMRLARDRGARVLAVTNVAGSQATREADGVLLTRAGIEIGVAATKTFLAQAAVLHALALRLAQLRGTLAQAALVELADELALMPGRIDLVLSAVQGPVKRIAERLARSEFFLYLGRQAGLPIALEGALKLKEIAYIPTDAYAAGEMKHGPIALLGERTPVVCLATEADVLAKTLSNIAEVRARGAEVIAIAAEGSLEVAEYAEEVLYMPPTDPLLQTLLGAIPLQLLAYEIARERGLNVDRPRNLAKTVTVE